MSNGTPITFHPRASLKPPGLRRESDGLPRVVAASDGKRSDREMSGAGLET